MPFRDYRESLFEATPRKYEAKPQNFSPSAGKAEPFRTGRRLSRDANRKFTRGVSPKEKFLNISIHFTCYIGFALPPDIPNPAGISRRFSSF